VPEPIRLSSKRVDKELERLKVVVKAAGMNISHRQNILGRYTRVLEPEFLAETVVAKIEAELMAEIEKEMLSDPRTAILVQGKDGRQIQEKRKGQFKKVPKLDDGSHRNSPVKIDIKKDRDGEVRMTVKLNHPLYIVMHSGTRPHSIRPVGGMHVFPTAEAVAAGVAKSTGGAGGGFHSEFTPYDLQKLKSIPWWGKVDGKRVRFKIAYPAPIPAYPRSGPEFGRAGNTGFGAPHPFIAVSWRRVTRRLRDRYQRILTNKMKSGV
jgi:hypothetical protein